MIRAFRYGGICGVMLLWTAAASAQELPETGWTATRSGSSEESSSGETASGEVIRADWLGETLPAEDSALQPAGLWSPGDDGGVCVCPIGPALYAGAQFLWIRPHFSEAIAFAHGTQTPVSQQTQARELDFDYEGSPRVFLGYRFANRDEFRFTYWYSRSDVRVNGGAPPAGQFLVDPFGNLVGAAAVVDPRDGRFVPPPPAGAGPTILVGGDFIHTEAIVETSVYDFEYRRPLVSEGCRWCVDWSAGLRIADINQFYEAVITSAGAPFSRGDFAVDFVGAGPRVGLDARRAIGSSAFSLFARTHGSLLVGQYDVRFANRVFAPAAFTGGQTSSATRTIPVFETELGAAWQPNPGLRVSAGWLFQAWFDLGTSGGQFGGFFTGADDANIMSYDGLMLSVELAR